MCVYECECVDVCICIYARACVCVFAHANLYVCVWNEDDGVRKVKEYAK